MDTKLLTVAQNALSEKWIFRSNAYKKNSVVSNICIYYKYQTSINTNKKPATGSIQLVSSFFIVSRSSYIIIQSSFTSFSPKVFRLTYLDINSK